MKKNFSLILLMSANLISFSALANTSPLLWQRVSTLNSPLSLPYTSTDVANMCEGFGNNVACIVLESPYSNGSTYDPLTETVTYSFGIDNLIPEFPHESNSKGDGIMVPMQQNDAIVTIQTAQRSGFKSFNAAVSDLSYVNAQGQTVPVSLTSCNMSYSIASMDPKAKACGMDVTYLYNSVSQGSQGECYVQQPVCVY